MLRRLIVVGLVLAAGATVVWGASELAEPVRVKAGGEYIDTEVGHAAPFVCDFDGDGLKDLLVGQFGSGLLTIYRNVGSNARPEFAAGVKFMDGKPEGTVPSG